MENQKKLNCPSCRKSFAIDTDACQPGSVVQCTHCGKKLRLPGERSKAASPTESATAPKPMSPQEILLAQMSGSATPEPPANPPAAKHQAKPVSRPHAAHGEPLASAYPPPPVKKATALVWGIVVVLAAVGVLVAILVKINSMPPEGRVHTEFVPTPETPLRGLTPPSPEAIRRQAATERQPVPAATAAERIKADSIAAEDTTRESLTFKPFGPAATLPERPNRLFQLIEVTNSSDRHLASARGKVVTVLAGKPYATMDFRIFDVGPRQTRLLLSECEVPDTSGEIQFHPTYSNMVHADTPFFDVSARLQPLIHDGQTAGTALIEITNTGKRDTAGTRVTLVMLRENGDFSGYEERIVAPLKAGQKRVEELRWNRWPNYMIEKGVVYVEGLLERDAAELVGEEIKD